MNETRDQDSGGTKEPPVNEAHDEHPHPHTRDILHEIEAEFAHELEEERPPAGGPAYQTVGALVALAMSLGGHSAILDGEVIARDGHGRPNLARLQRRLRVQRPSRTLLSAVPASFCVYLDSSTID
jgi:hypothetical protein